MTATTAVQSVLHSFTYGVDFLREQVGDVSEAQWVTLPPGIANHPAWTVGHITLTCQEIGGVLGLAAWLPDAWRTRYGTGSVPAADVVRYAAKEEAIARLMDARHRVTLAVESASESRLGKPFPDPAYLPVFPTIGHALTQVLVGHTAYHVGQMGSWRRAMGLSPMGRSFE